MVPVYYAKLHCIADWNQLKRILPDLLETDPTYSQLKLLIKQPYLNKY